MMAFSTILLDLDGTITDPYIGITNGVMYAYEKLGLEVPERESLRSFIGPPLMVEFTRRGFPEEQAREAVRLYREYYGRTGLFENRLIPGTVEFLKELKRMGKRVCLATSKPEEFSVRILEKFGVLEYFDFVGAATMDGSRGSKLGGYPLCSGIHRGKAGGVPDGRRQNARHHRRPRRRNEVRCGACGIRQP